MKKMIYILVLSLGIGFSQSVSACWPATQTETRNGVQKITYVSGNVVYKCTYPYGKTVEVGHRSDLYRGVIYKGSFFKWIKINKQPLSREIAEVNFEAFKCRFDGIQPPV